MEELVRIEFIGRPTVVVALDGERRAWRALVPGVLAYDQGVFIAGVGIEELVLYGVATDQSRARLLALHNTVGAQHHTIGRVIGQAFYCTTSFDLLPGCDRMFDFVARNRGSGSVYFGCFRDPAASAKQTPDCITWTRATRH